MKYKVTLNGRTYEVEVEAGKAMLLDEYEAIVPSAPAAPAAAPAAAAPAAPAAAAAPVVTGAGEAVNAPMPGTILKVNVTQGQKVAEGDVVVVGGEQRGNFLGNGVQGVVGIGFCDVEEDHRYPGEQVAGIFVGQHRVFKGGRFGVGHDRVDLGAVLLDAF